ncbi:MAG: amidohydrolase family protein [Saccharofermentanales bacterium]
MEGESMIIDSHTHFGSMLDFDMPAAMLIRSMDLHGIDCAVVSSLEGIEFDHDGHPLPQEMLHNQIGINREAIEFSRKYPGRIFPLIWAMPHTGGVTPEFKQFVANRRPEIYGFKFHPYLNNVPFDSPLVDPYIRLAAEYGLPVAIHTASTDESSPARVAAVARKYTDVKFLLVHLGLYTDNEESIGLILKHPNLYGDTTWVRPENTMKLIQQGGIDKIMFGTDAPVGGIDGYLDPMIQTYLHEWQDILGVPGYKMLMSENAIRFFGIRGISDQIR